MSERFPYGVESPARDFQIVDSPSADVDILGRGFLVVAGGTVSVTTEKGATRTVDLDSGVTIICMITQVLSATDATLLVYTD